MPSIVENLNFRVCNRVQKRLKEHRRQNRVTIQASVIKNKIIRKRQTTYGMYLKLQAYAEKYRHNNKQSIPKLMLPVKLALFLKYDI